MNFDIGTVVDLTYPTSTAIGASDPQWKLRHLQILQIRDLVREPLTVDDYFRRPLIHRGRLLLIGRDTESGLRRQFYLSNSREFFFESPICVGLFEPEATRPQKVLARVYEPSAHDRILLARSLREWRSMDWGELRLGIYSDDLRVRS